MNINKQVIDQLSRYFVRRDKDTTFGGDILPDSQDTHNLGSSSRRVNIVYARSVVADNLGTTEGGGIGNADTVDGFHASSTPSANYLIALDGSAHLPTSVYDQAVLINGTRAMTDDLEINPSTAKAPFTLGANAQGQLVTGLNADMIDGQHVGDLGGAPEDAQYLTLATSTDLTSERVFTPGNGLAGTDGGAGSTYTLAVDLASPSGLSFSSGNLQVDDTLAGNGLSISSKVMAVGVSGLGLSTDANSVILTSSSNTGVNARILATDSNGTLQIEALGLATSANASGRLQVMQTNTNPSGNVFAISATTKIADTTTYPFNIASVLEHSQTGGANSNSLANFFARFVVSTTQNFTGNLYNVSSEIYSYNTGNIGSFRHFVAGAGYDSTGNTDITTLYGLEIANSSFTVTGSQYGLYVASLTSGANNYPIYTNAGTISFGDNLEFRQPSSINTTSGNLTLSPAGDLILDPTGNDVLPENNYDISLGSSTRKFLDLYAGELWVETLVAQETIATIGGRVLVGETNVLADLLVIQANKVTDGSFETGVGSNLLTNGSFETAGSGGSDVFGTWTETIGSGGSITRDGTTYSNGSYSAKLTQGTTDTYVYQSSISVTANVRYALTFWTRGDGTYAGGYRVQNQNTSANIIAETSTGATSTTWTPVHVQFTPPTGCTAVRIYFYAPPGGSGQSAWFDDSYVLRSEWTNWTESYTGGSIIPDPYVVSDDVYSIRLAYSTGSPYVYQDFSVTAGDYVSFTFWTSGDGAREGRYRFYDVSNSSDIIAVTGTTVTGTTLRKVVAGGTIPAGCSTARLYLYSPSTAGYANFDEVRVYGGGVMTVKYNNFTQGDYVYLESGGSFEFLKIMSGASASGLYYKYNVARSIDATTPNAWVSGDAVFNTGQATEGFIDLYSISNIGGGLASGPTIVGNVRTASTYADDYNAYEERWAVGNLSGVFNVGVDTYGVAFGDPNATYMQIDATNGIQMYNNATQTVALTPSGTFWVGKSTSTERLQYDPTNGLRLFNASNEAVITLGTSGDAKFTARMELSGSNAEISIGSTPPTNKTTGTGLFIDRTGLYTVSTDLSIVYIDATDGAFYTGYNKGVSISRYGIILDSVGSSGYGRDIRWGNTDNISAPGQTGALDVYIPASFEHAGLFEIGDIDPANNYNNSITLKLYGATYSTQNEPAYTMVMDQIKKRTTFDHHLAVEKGLYVGGDTLPSGTGNIGYSGYLYSSGYTVYAYHPFVDRSSNTSWDGDAKSTTSGTNIDVTTGWSSNCPDGVKAVNLRVRIDGGAAGDYILIGNTSDANHLYVRQEASGSHGTGHGIVSINADDYIRVVISATSNLNVYIWVLGYFI